MTSQILELQLDLAAGLSVWRFRVDGDDVYLVGERSECIAAFASERGILAVDGDLEQTIADLGAGPSPVTYDELQSRLDEWREAERGHYACNRES